MNVNNAPKTEQRKQVNGADEVGNKAKAASCPIINLTVSSKDFQVIVGDKIEHHLGSSPVRKEE